MYPAAGEGFRTSYAFGGMLSMFTAVIAISMLSGIVYNIMAALSTMPAGEKRGVFTKGFFITNGSNLVFSIVFQSLQTAYNKNWITGMLQIMWALMLSGSMGFAWLSSLKLERTRSAMAAGAGRVFSSRKGAERKMSASAKATEGGQDKKSANRINYWRSLKSLTVLVAVCTLGLFGLGVSHLLDTQKAFFPESVAFDSAFVLIEVVQSYSLSHFTSHTKHANSIDQLLGSTARQHHRHLPFLVATYAEDQDCHKVKLIIISTN
jgi:hypothetical protein